MVWSLEEVCTYTTFYIILNSTTLVFLMIAILTDVTYLILTDVTWYLILVLIFISMVIKNFELLIYQLAIGMSSLEVCIFNSSAHFLIELFVFLWILRILDINSLSDIHFANIFPLWRLSFLYYGKKYFYYIYLVCWEFLSWKDVKFCPMLSLHQDDYIYPSLYLCGVSHLLIYIHRTILATQG